MKKVIVTGTAGFILGNFIRRCIYSKQPYQFSSIDRINGNANAVYLNKNHSFHIGDLRDSHVLDKIFQFEQPDIVIHGAAESFVDYSLSNPNEFITSNVLATQNVINSCVKHNIEKLIYVSTDEVYGQLSSENDPLWTEDSPLNPRNPYSASKAAGELLVKAAHHSYGLNYNITRSSNNYGPRQTSEKLIPKVIKNILNNEKIPIYGEGNQIRDWTHVFDNCAALATVLNYGEPNETYNISANQELTNLELVQKICNYMGKGHDLITHIEDPRKGHDFRYGIDCSKINKIGWKPLIKFKDGITDTIDWYLLNKWMLA